MLVLKNNFLEYPVDQVLQDDKQQLRGFAVRDVHTDEPFTVTIPEEKRARQKDWKDWLKDLGYQLREKK